METDYIYWRHRTPVGIKVEEVSGAEQRSGKVWREMALQVYKENGREGYRDLGHYDSGAPFLHGDNSRVSVTHCDGLLAVATLPRTPEADLSSFSQRTAMGIDAERADRAQVLKVRNKFLSEAEQAMVAPDDVKANILAWTSKEALYKAALLEGLDLVGGIRLERLADPATGAPGAATVKCGDGKVYPMELYSWESEGCVVTLAYSPKCAKFMKGAK